MWLLTSSIHKIGRVDSAIFSEPNKNFFGSIGSTMGLVTKLNCTRFVPLNGVPVFCEINSSLWNRILIQIISLLIQVWGNLLVQFLRMMHVCLHLALNLQQSPCISYQHLKNEAMMIKVEHLKNKRVSLNDWTILSKCEIYFIEQHWDMLTMKNGLCKNLF